MIIHSYLTDGLFGWAKIFVESFGFYHGTDYRIFLSTRDLNEKQQDELMSLYSNLHISNKPLNLKRIAARAKMSVRKIKDLKTYIENNAVTKNTFIWKQAISVEDRYRNSITEAMRAYPDEDFLIHFDIDMYFRSHLQQLFEIIRNNDISIKFRLNSKINRKVMGGLIGFKLNNKTKKFMRRWIYHIDTLPLYDKPLGYGQTSFYLAHCDLKDDLKWGHIPSKFISPRFAETDVIWSGNSKRGKVRNLKICYKDFKEKKNK
jgi:hypothetical protein